MEKYFSLRTFGSALVAVAVFFLVIWLFTRFTGKTVRSYVSGSPDKQSSTVSGTGSSDGKGTATTGSGAATPTNGTATETPVETEEGSEAEVG